MKATLFACVLAIVATGCGSKQARVTKATDPTSSRGPAGGRGNARPPTQVAQGDLRQILLHLQRVHFAYDATTLLPQARASLQQVAEHLNAHRDVQLSIDGHTDLRGTTEYNLGLGDRRAHAVRDYLVHLGVDPGRLQTVSFGSERPMRDGASTVDHAENRRVEFRLMQGSVELVLDDGPVFDDRGAPIVARRR